MNEPIFEHVVFFNEASATRFSAFSREANRGYGTGRDLVASALSRKKGIKALFREMPGEQGVFIYNSNNAKPAAKRDNHVVPVSDMEALGVERLTSDQIQFLEARGAIVIENKKLRRLKHVKKQSLNHAKPNPELIWHIDELLGEKEKSIPGTSVRVGVVDTGVNTEHPEFKNTRLVASRIRGHRVDPITGIDGDLLDHGTSVASLICGKSVGLFSNAELAVCDVFEDADGARPLDILKGISWLKSNPFGDGRGVDVINLSLGVEGYTEVFREAISEALMYDGIMFVGAIGNDGHRSGPCCSPACYNEVLSVGAYDESRDAASFSNCGKSRPSDPDQPDIWAPGVDVYAATANGKYDSIDGTSFASPLVAALAARTIGGHREVKGDPSKVIEILLGAAQPNSALPCSQKMARAPY